jgi:hypothetical protein
MGDKPWMQRKLLRAYLNGGRRAQWLLSRLSTWIYWHCVVVENRFGPLLTAAEHKAACERFMERHERYIDELEGLRKKDKKQ